MSIQGKISGFIFLSSFSFVSLVQAETYYLENAKSSTKDNILITKANSSTLDFMLGVDKNMIGRKRLDSDFTLQPRIIKVGKGLVIKIEKKNKAGKLISVSQAKAPLVTDIDKAIAKAVGDAIKSNSLKK